MIVAENDATHTALLFRVLLLDMYIHTTMRSCLDCSQSSIFEQDGCLNHLCMWLLVSTETGL